MQRLAELCGSIIQNSLGELAARIFERLEGVGRATLATIRELTGIPYSQLRVGLTSLIQYHIVVHCVDDYGETYFQVDWHAAYVLVRAEKIQRLVGQRHGEAAARVMDQVLQLGLVAVGDLTEEYSKDVDVANDSVMDEMNGGPASEDQTKDHSTTNCTSKNSTMTRDQCHSTLITLLEHGFLIKVGSRSFIPAVDLQQIMHDTVVREKFPDGRISGPKRSVEFTTELNTLKRKWQDEDEFSAKRDVIHQGSSKRMKLDSIRRNCKGHETLPDGVGEESRGDFAASSPELPNDMVVRVNYHKSIVALRTERLERMAHRYLGPVTAAVYGALLRTLERKDLASRDVYKADDERSDHGHNDDDDVKYDEDEPERYEKLSGAHDWEVLQNLDQSIDLASPVRDSDISAKTVSDPKENGTVGKSYRKTGRGNRPVVPADSDSEAEDEPYDGVAARVEHQKRLNLVKWHLQLLEEHPKAFCIRRMATDITSVDITALTRALIQTELDTMIAARHGPMSTRVIRVLREKGKLDEKQIADFCMKHLKELQPTLSNLQAYTLAEMQEVPREPVRQPNRSIYLWYFAEERVQDMFLQHAYQGMSRLLQRLHAERMSSTYRTAVDKAESADVVGREQELLTHQEREIVKKWRDIEEHMLIQVSRIDDVVALLRDFNGKDTSLDT